MDRFKKASIMHSSNIDAVRAQMKNVPAKKSAKVINKTTTPKGTTFKKSN